jgi:hypothetical protein
MLRLQILSKETRLLLPRNYVQCVWFVTLKQSASFIPRHTLLSPKVTEAIARNFVDQHQQVKDFDRAMWKNHNTRRKSNGYQKPVNSLEACIQMSIIYHAICHVALTFSFTFESAESHWTYFVCIKMNNILLILAIFVSRLCSMLFQSSRNLNHRTIIMCNFWVTSVTLFINLDSRLILRR